METQEQMTYFEMELSARELAIGSSERAYSRKSLDTQRDDGVMEGIHRIVKEEDLGKDPAASYIF